MSTRLLMISATLLAACVAGAAENGLLLHYSFEEGSGDVAEDASGNELHGHITAARVVSPSGSALSSDGSGPGLVRVQLPPEQRFGTDSWSFSAWLRPEQFSIDDPQNQRRIFAFGIFPDAYLVIDLFSTGRPGYYFCYKDEAGATVSTVTTNALDASLSRPFSVCVAVILCPASAIAVAPSVVTVTSLPPATAEPSTAPPE